MPTITTTRNKREVGRLRYREYEGRVTIHSIEVDATWRRQGIGTAMATHLRRRHPKARLVAPLMNPAGRALLRSPQIDRLLQPLE